MFIAVQEVTHSFAGQPALFQDLDLKFQPGVITGIVGPSGSGKSTLLSILAGAQQVQTGVVIYEKVESIGWIFQNPVGSPRRTALDQVALPFLARGFDRSRAEAEARQLLSRFGLTKVSERQFRHLSGGEAQRVGFARAIAAEFDAILIDEPTAQLDPVTARTVREVIRELAAPHRVVVLATHDQELRSQCDAVVELGVRPAQQPKAPSELPTSQSGVPIRDALRGER